MGEFKYVSPDEVARRHRLAQSKAQPRQRMEPDPPQQRNVKPVLSLGDVRYISFGRRTYAIPPVPFKLGQRVLNTQVTVLAHAKQVAKTGDKEPTLAYYRELSRLAGLLWLHVRPVGMIRRWCWRLGLMRNPFRLASEAEMRAITDFFLKGRMTSSVRSMPETEARA
jgi:hypothetical protein